MNALGVAAEHDAAGRHDDAVDALARAAQRGDHDAMTELAKRLIVGDHAPLLPQDGVGLLGEAMRAGNVEATLRLAALAALGAHVQPSWQDAMTLLVLAAERGSASACEQLCALAGTSKPAGPVAADHWRRLIESVDFGAWFAEAPGTTLHDDPLVRSFPEFVGDTVCDWLIARARGNLKRALIYDPSYRRDVADEMRTNSAAGFDLMQADLEQIAVQYRMAAATGLPVRHMEGPTVLHYDVGEQITNHYDFVNPDIPNYRDEIERRGERVITFLVYLNDDYAGGETDFPGFGIRHKGRRREGLFFVNALPTGGPDRRMVHAGLPPTSGEKWIVSQFIRNRPALNTRAERLG
jgi:hypothetical protein